MSKILAISCKISLTLALAFVMTVSVPVFMQSGMAISEQNIANLTNSERTRTGLASLSWNGALANSANTKASHMCTHDYWAHVAPDGTTPWSFVSAAGYAYTAVAENLAKGFSSDSAVVSGWMASPGHKANILNGAFKDIGVASKACKISGKSVTLVVAHYGSTGAARPQSEPKSATHKQASPTQRAPAQTTNSPNTVKSAKKVVKTNAASQNQQPASKTTNSQPEQSAFIKLLLGLIGHNQSDLLLQP